MSRQIKKWKGEEVSQSSLGLLYVDGVGEGTGLVLELARVLHERHSVSIVCTFSHSASSVAAAACSNAVTATNCPELFAPVLQF